VGKTFVFDANLGELAKELRESVASGRMRIQDAMDVMKAAIRKAFQEKAQVIKDDSVN